MGGRKRMGGSQPEKHSVPRGEVSVWERLFPEFFIRVKVWSFSNLFPGEGQKRMFLYFNKKSWYAGKKKEKGKKEGSHRFSKRRKKMFLFPLLLVGYGPDGKLNLYIKCANPLTSQYDHSYQHEC